MDGKKASDFDPNVLRLFDQYVHGAISRREFLDKSARYAAAGLSATALLDSLSPNYARAQQVLPGDSRITTEYITYLSPGGAGTIRALLVKPAGASGKRPGVVVVHENRGLNPYIEDVARRLGTAGFIALAPDALTPLGGYPGNDDEGRAMQQKRDSQEMLQDFVNAAEFLMAHDATTGRVGVVGFCYGGSVSNQLAVRLPTLGAAVPFYGSQAAAADVPKIQAPLLIHYASNDERVNAGWPAYEAALKAHGKRYTMHMYEGTEHGFHNDTTPRYDTAAAALAWQRTVEFFETHLK